MLHRHERIWSQRPVFKPTRSEARANDGDSGGDGGNGGDDGGGDDGFTAPTPVGTIPTTTETDEAATITGPAEAQVS